MLLLYRLLAILLTLSISRWMLYMFNSQFFHQLSLGQALYLFFYGMRFDLPVVVALNILTIIYYCFPSRSIFNRGGQKFVDFFYVTLSSIDIFLNFIDIVCFNFFGKHITLDFLKVVGRSGEISLTKNPCYQSWKDPKLIKAAEKYKTSTM